VSLERGTRLGPYEIESVLGAGGMGEVYRARDTRLKRDVAIKVLPAAFASDPDRIARFQREAEVLATLNHPNIAAVYGFQETPAASGIVLELVEGPTLGDRTAHGAIPIDEALTIAKQIADALDAAHEKGIVHRDLKPANIKITPGGKVKVLDFGLAKMADAAPARGSSLSMSPTLAVQATSAGLILGTAGYMSPEQARGKAVDRRTDIWSFGCVLYEMLTGRPVFDTGETVSDSVAAILTREPDWKRLPAPVPDSIRRLLRRCLEKDPDRRLHHIADARLEIIDGLTASGDAGVTGRASVWIRVLPWAVAIAALGVAAVALSRADSTTPVGQPAAAVRRMELTLPAGVELFTSTKTVAVSPDGSRVAFVGVRTGVRQVFLRALDQFEVVPLQGSDNATACFFSPDGRSLAVMTNVGVFKTISLANGSATTLTDAANFLYGGDWSEDDQIVFRSGRHVVADPRVWRHGRSAHQAGRTTRRHAARTSDDCVRRRSGAFCRLTPGAETRIDALVLATGERHTVIDRGTLPLYAESGHLVFVRGGELLMTRFDADRLSITVPPPRPSRSFRYSCRAFRRLTSLRPAPLSTHRRRP
jgi:hypothetical protein